MAKVDEPTKRKRILILGSAPHTRLVTAYAWDNLPLDLNVSDFDVVILNFVPFEDKEFAQGINIDLMPAQQQFARHIFSVGSEIIVVGSPNFRLGANPYLRSTWWLPVDIHFTYERGEEIRILRDSFRYYLNGVRSWSFYFEGFDEANPEFVQAYLSIAVPGADTLSMANFDSIAETRFNRSIAFQLHFRARKTIRTNWGDERLETVRVSGAAIWLPRPTEVSDSEAINLILKERYSLLFEEEPPKWISKFSLPTEMPIKTKIQAKESEIAKLNLELSGDNLALAKASRFRKLLYEQGEDVLEPIVRDALRELGADVRDPIVRGREDGRLVDPSGSLGMLEIKGRSGTLKLADVREIDHWVRDAIANEDWQCKGILIVNLQCELEPSKRKDFIPSNCSKAAENFGICILTTTQLFHALVTDQESKLDRKKFWNDIFSTNGICRLPELSSPKTY